MAGFSAYPRELEYKKFRATCDKVGAKLVVDMSHISGLVAAGVSANPFEYADVVTSTTHKTLRGPRSGMIFGRKELMDDIDTAVFPASQGGPHNHQVAALCAQLKQANTEGFRTYVKQVKANAQALANGL